MGNKAMQYFGKQDIRVIKVSENENKEFDSRDFFYSPRLGIHQPTEYLELAKASTSPEVLKEIAYQKAFCPSSREIINEILKNPYCPEEVFVNLWNFVEGNEEIVDILLSKEMSPSTFLGVLIRLAASHDPNTRKKVVSFSDCPASILFDLFKVERNNEIKKIIKNHPNFSMEKYVEEWAGAEF